MPRSRNADPDQLIPIPPGISAELAFLDEGLTTAQWEQRARAVVRRHLRGRGVGPGAGPFTEYDARVARLMREVAEEG